MKKILITGNAGMIGSVLSTYLCDKDYQVIGIDNLSGGYYRNIDERVSFIQGDIRNESWLNPLFEFHKPNYVIHCAAFAAEILSPFVRNFNYSNNLLGSINLINASVNHRVEKFINFSSIATYGEQEPPFRENQTKIPKDCYGIAKYAVELDLEEAYQHFGLKYSNVMPHNVVSKYQNYFDRYRNAIAIWVRQCLLGEDITIFGDGSQTRAFSDCKFIREPIEKLLTDFDGLSFNLGSDVPISIKDAAQTVLNVWKEINGTCESQLKFLPARREVKHAYSCHELAKEKLGFKDETDLKSLIKEMFEYIIQIKPQEVGKMKYEITKGMYKSWL